jgi:predicted small lipoprotein YifL
LAEPGRLTGGGDGRFAHVEQTSTPGGHQTLHLTVTLARYIASTLYLSLLSGVSVITFSQFRSSSLSVLVTALLASLAACGGTDGALTLPESATAQLTILETSDLHANVVSYDYFKLAEDKSLGL